LIDDDKAIKDAHLNPHETLPPCRSRIVVGVIAIAALVIAHLFITA
tara:strand:- start:288 stop:425 length:138 start_codon:yes stop_codon:yes gene_type:complete